MNHHYAPIPNNQGTGQGPSPAASSSSSSSAPSSTASSSSSSCPAPSLSSSGNSSPSLWSSLVASFINLIIGPQYSLDDLRFSVVEVEEAGKLRGRLDVQGFDPQRTFESLNYYYRRRVVELGTHSRPLAVVFLIVYEFARRTTSKVYIKVTKHQRSVAWRKYVFTVRSW
eukprot:TRINITY_DN1936_c0_g1_i3.p1 TRINITY_DN1936_c0_g1~~TRINITY_DN1936_c0_g1_i3.p1  ORF type:complete len:200 (-),score=0.33 TRINITY_DN1936_c0_g1_i3:588-1097(-)